jgi:hypothetical protein
MKKLIVVLSLLVCYNAIIAQITFEEDTLSTFLKDARGGTLSIADIDGDGDLDMFASGKDHPNMVSTMYKNDGNGVFTEMTGTNFESAEFGHSDFADIDGDGDQDLLLIGRFSSFSLRFLYINDGNGNFTENTSTPILETQSGDFEFFDADNDNDMDLIISGNSTTQANILNPINHTTLYLNNGSGVFTEATGTPFEALTSSSIAVIDYDNNQTNDFVITGLDDNDNPVTKLYSNDGTGTFSLVQNTSFNNIKFAKLEVADTDNDGDTDILIVGQTLTSTYQADLYANDGSGNFSIVSGTSIVGGTSGTLDFGDFDNDGDADILMTGINATGVFGLIYENQGNNSFSVAASLIDIYESSTVVGDIDNDNDLDAIIVGTPSVGGNNNSPGSSFRPRMYFNETIISGTSFIENSTTTFVYPNPTNGILNFKSDEVSPSTIKIFDTLGKLVYFDENVVTNSQIFLNQPTGLYIILIETGDVSSVQKVILEK